MTPCLRSRPDESFISKVSGADHLTLEGGGGGGGVGGCVGDFWSSSFFVLTWWATGSPSSRFERLVGINWCCVTLDR